MIQAECVFIFGHKLLPLAFPFDGRQFVGNGLTLSVKLHHTEKFVQLFHAVGFATHGVFQSVDAVTQHRHTLLQFLRRCEFILHKIIANLVELFEIADLCFLTPSPGVTIGVILAEKLRQIWNLRLAQFLMRFFQPIKQRRDFLFQIADQIVGRLDPAVEITLGMVILIACIVSGIGMVAMTDMNKLFGDPAYLQARMSSACFKPL